MNQNTPYRNKFDMKTLHVLKLKTYIISKWKTKNISDHIGCCVGPFDVFAIGNYFTSLQCYDVRWIYETAKPYFLYQAIFSKESQGSRALLFVGFNNFFITKTSWNCEF